MNSILGVKRIVFLAILGAFCLFIGGGNYYYVMPETTALEGRLKSTEGQFYRKQGEINQLRNEFTRLQDQLSKYKILENMGFFNVQDRVTARETFTKLQKGSGLLWMKYRLDSSRKLEFNEARDINHMVISSPVEVNIEALDDVDVFHFIQMVREKFPGDISFKQIEIERVMDINSTVIRRIGNGEPEVLVKAVINFDWRSMAPEDSIDENLFK